MNYIQHAGFGFDLGDISTKSLTKNQQTILNQLLHKKSPNKVNLASVAYGMIEKDPHAKVAASIPTSPKNYLALIYIPNICPVQYPGQPKPKLYTNQEAVKILSDFVVKLFQKFAKELNIKSQSINNLITAIKPQFKSLPGYITYTDTY